jgi:anti-anti-sigma regulatory factor
MLRISWRETPEGGRILLAEGRISGRWIEELQGACDRAVAETGGLALDVAGVTFVDPDGARVLRGLARAGGVTFVHASAYVAEILKGER